MSEIKLKRCPFCGGEAILEKMDDLGNWVVRCKKCFCRTPRSMTKFFPTVAWNTRKPMEEIVERLEEREKSHLRVSYMCVTPKYELKEIQIARTYRMAIEIVKEVGGMNE